MIPALTTPPALLLLTAIAAYGLGSVSFGLVMARLFGLGDLRRIGSGAAKRRWLWRCCKAWGKTGLKESPWIP